MKIRLLLISILTLISCKDNRTSEQIISDANSQINKSEYQNALTDLKKLIDNGIETTEVFQLKGISENGLNKNSKSLLSFQKSIELDNKNYISYVERANLKIKLGDYRGAIEDCNNAMLIQRDYAKTYKTKAIAYELLEDEPNSIIQYQAAIKYGDNSGENNYKLGVLFLNKGDLKQGCDYLSKAGEKGYLDAYDLIKTNCNENIQDNTNLESKRGQFRSYTNKFAVKFPSNWNIDKIANSDNSTFVVFALGLGENDGNITISETQPIFLDPSFKPNTIFDIDKDEFIEESRNKYDDFRLLNFEKTKVDNVNAYYYQMTFSFFSNKLQKQLSGTHSLYVFLHPKSKKLYNVIGYSDNEDADYNSELLKETIKSFKFL